MTRCILFFIALLTLPVHADDTEAILRDWISKQATIRSLRADFIQTRRLPALRIPLKKSGTVWFGTEGRFRWQVGNPAELLVVKSPNDFLVIEPKKSIARRLSASSAVSRVFEELPVPFAVSLDEFQRRFEVVSLENNADQVDLLLLPRIPASIPQLEPSPFLKWSFATAAKSPRNSPSSSKIPSSHPTCSSLTCPV
jgi:hypothetical protein